MPRQPYPIVAGPESEPHEPDEQRALAERRDEQLADTGIHVALYGFQCKRRHVLRQQEGREHVRMAATRDPAYLAVGLRRLANDLRSLCVLAHSTQVPATCGVSDGEAKRAGWAWLGVHWGSRNESYEHQSNEHGHSRERRQVSPPERWEDSPRHCATGHTHTHSNVKSLPTMVHLCE